MSWIGQKVKNFTNSEKLRRKKLKDDSFETSVEQLPPSSSPPPPPLSPSPPPSAMAAQRLQLFQHSESSMTRNPLAWDNIPSALRQQFPHWEKQAFPSPDVNKRVSIGSPAAISPMSRYSKYQDSAPENTIPYVVMIADTLNTISLKFDTTPAEIARINKKSLSSFQILPGQLLFVPDCSPPVLSLQQHEEDVAYEDHAPLSAPPRIANFDKHYTSDLSSSSSGKIGLDDDEVCDDYIRMTAKFITECEGCVDGNLLFNSQSLMFRPDPSCPLVQEKGADVFEILLPLGNIVHVVVSSNCSFPDTSIFSDKSRDVKVISVSPPYAPPIIISDTRQRRHRIDQEEVEENGEQLTRDERPENDGPLENNIEREETEEQSCDGRVELNCNVEDSLVPSQLGSSVSQIKSLALLSNAAHQDDSNPSTEDLLSGMEPTAEASPLVSPPNELRDEEEEDIDEARKKMMDSLRSCQFLHVRVSQTAQQEAPLVGIAIPVSARGGQDRKDSVSLVRTWFCFAVPEQRVDPVRDFLLAHHPSVVQGTNAPHSEKTSNGSFEVINVGGNFSEDALTISESHFRSSWEVFSVRDFQPQKIERMEVENNLPLPILSEPSCLLEESHIRKLTPKLISPAVGHDWCLIYSTFQHGISLHTLYRKMVDFEDSPVLLLVREQTGNLFGVMVSCTLRVSERFYGTGESFMFSFNDDGAINVFQWTGINDFIVKGSPDSIAFGSGDGHFGLWLDESFYHGSSLPCSTFDNKCLSSREDFICEGVEAWGFR